MGQACQVAHIVPNSLTDREFRPSLQDSLNNFWSSICDFWTEDRVESWFNQLGKNWTETPINLLTLRSDCHTVWAKGMFALEPIEADDEAEDASRVLRVKFHWLPRIEDRCFLPINTKPGDVCNKKTYEGPKPYQIMIADTAAQIETGHVLTLRTSDPIKLPLPSRELLQMQFLLHQVVAMSGAADFLDYEDSDSDDEYAGEDKYVEASDEEWSESLHLPPAQYPGSSSSDKALSSPLKGKNPAPVTKKGNVEGEGSILDRSHYLA